MVGIIAIVAVFIFLYFKNYLDNKRDQRRFDRLERHKELLEKTLDTIRDKDKQGNNK